MRRPAAAAMRLARVLDAAGGQWRAERLFTLIRTEKGHVFLSRGHRMWLADPVARTLCPLRGWIEIGGLTYAPQEPEQRICHSNHYGVIAQSYSLAVPAFKHIAIEGLNAPVLSLSQRQSAAEPKTASSPAPSPSNLRPASAPSKLETGGGPQSAPAAPNPWIEAEIARAVRAAAPSERPAASPAPPTRTIQREYRVTEYFHTFACENEKGKLVPPPPIRARFNPFLSLDLTKGERINGGFFSLAVFEVFSPAD